jgi:uncharacterized protein DUF6011
MAYLRHMESNSSRKQITAKFASRCPSCGTLIEAGTQVMWAAGTKATHVLCPTSPSKWDSNCEIALSEGYVRFPVSGTDKDDRSYEAWLAFSASQTVAAPQPARQSVKIEDAGVYVLEDLIVKMKANKAKTATYPMLWTEISGERLNGEDAHVRGEWRYIEDWQERRTLVDRIVANGRRMNLGEAKAFIIRYGQCVRCSRHLKAAKSVEAGIGPVCIKYFEGASGAEVLLASETIVDRAVMQHNDPNFSYWSLPVAV